MIAGALWFNSGILLFADAAPPAAGGERADSRKIFTKQYGSNPGCARSIFVISEANDGRIAALHHVEHALASFQPVDCTMTRMRQAVEQSLLDTGDDEVDFVVLYSSADNQYALFRTTGTMLQDVVGYDCEGRAAYLGHSLMHDRYAAARSMDTLDLEHVFSIATETLDGIRAVHKECGKASEMVVMYADGHISDIRHIDRDTRKQRNAALGVLGHT